jgi:drug/metabolite transporter (DMT)-like permease
MSRLTANLVLLFVAAIWGTTFIVQQTVLQHMGPLSFISVRFLLGAVILAPLVRTELRRLRREGRMLTRRSWQGMMLTGVVLFAGAVLQQLGIGLTTVTNASFLTALYVPLVPLLALLVSRVAPAPVVWPAAAACVVGAWLMSGADALNIASGDMLIIVGAVFWAVHILLIGAVSKNDDAPLTLAWVQFVVCGLLAAVTAAVLEDFRLANLAPAWFEIVYSGVLSSALAFSLQVMAQRFSTAADAAIIFSMEAVIATLAGVMLLGERPTPTILAGCAIITIAALAVQLVPPPSPRQLAPEQG